MNYSKIGPVCAEMVKLAELEGYKFPKLVVIEWEDRTIELELICFKQGTNHVKHVLSNEDVLFEKVNGTDARECIYGIPVTVIYDRIHNVYTEDISDIKYELLKVIESDDIKYDGLRKVLDEYAFKGANLEVEDIQRRITVDSRELVVLKRQIEYMCNEEIARSRKDEPKTSYPNKSECYDTNPLCGAKCNCQD